jgi:hypothetical protein
MNTHECIFRALLILYPARFRKRFGREMEQIFADCFRGESSIWLGTLKDLAISLPREWHREWTAADSEIDFTGIVDLVLISVVVGSNLIGWGWLAAAVTLHIDATFGELLNPQLTANSWYVLALALMVVVTIAMAALIGILSAAVVGRMGRPQNTHIKV